MQVDDQSGWPLTYIFTGVSFAKAPSLGVCFSLATVEIKKETPGRRGVPKPHSSRGDEGSRGSRGNPWQWNQTDKQVVWTPKWRGLFGTVPLGMGHGFWEASHYQCFVQKAKEPAKAKQNSQAPASTSRYFSESSSPVWGYPLVWEGWMLEMNRQG